MKTILEVTPNGRTVYEMPDAIYDKVAFALRHRIARRVRSAVAMLPGDLASMITARHINEPKKIRGHSADVIFIDDAIALK
jgi:hypothetical protein